MERALRYLASKALPERRREVLVTCLELHEKGREYVTPKDIEPLFSHAKMRHVLTVEALRSLAAEGLAEKVGHAKYRLTELGREVAELVRRLGID